MKRLSVATVAGVVFFLLARAPEEALCECSSVHDPDGNEVQCDPVPVDSCRQAGYQNTSFPTPLYPTSILAEADYSNHSALLLSLDCAKYVPVEHFICSAAFPLCVPDLFQQIGPCRELCLAVRESCTQELASIGVVWPSALDCSQYEPYGTAICVSDSSGALCNSGSTPPPLITEGPTTNPPLTTNEEPMFYLSHAVCPKELVAYPNGSGVQFGGIEDCGESCYGAYFNQEQQSFALIWVTAWSLVCLLVSVICFLTYIINFSKIQSPESPIYYLALCYAFLALAYTVSIAVGREELFCNEDLTSGKNESALAADAIEVPLCALIFSILYYFSMASWVWWAVLATEWFLCSVKLSTISYKLSACFHAVGWGVPLVFLLTALSLELVSGDPVLRTCWISRGHELWFLLIPLFTLIFYSSVAIVVTFGWVVHLHRHSKGVNTSRRNSIKLSVLIRVGLYVTVYLLPMGVLFCCYWYQYYFRDEWEECFVNDASDCSGDRGPKFSVFMLQFAVSVIMGALAIIWIAANRNSFSAWKRALYVCHNRKSASPDSHSIMRQSESDPPSPFACTESSV